MVKRLCAIVAVAILAAPGTAAAATKPRFRLVGSGKGLTTDARYAAWQGSSGRVSLFDSVKGSVRQIDSPSDCRDGRLGTEKLIWSCGPERASGRILDLRSGAFTTVAPDPNSGAITIVWFDVGSVWAEARVSGNHYFQVANYYNLRDGSVIYPEHNRDVVPDLDLPDLWRPLCPGLTRPEYTDWYPDTQLFYPFAYETPYAVHSDDVGVTLHRCGGRPSRLLAHGPLTFDLRQGLVAIGTVKRVTAYDARHRRSTSWRISEIARGGAADGPPTVGLTDSHLLVAVHVGKADRVYAVRRPDRPTRTRR